MSQQHYISFNPQEVDIPESEYLRCSRASDKARSPPGELNSHNNGTYSKCSCCITNLAQNDEWPLSEGSKPFHGLGRRSTCMEVLDESGKYKASSEVNVRDDSSWLDDDCIAAYTSSSGPLDLISKPAIISFPNMSSSACLADETTANCLVLFIPCHHMALPESHQTTQSGHSVDKEHLLPSQSISRLSPVFECDVSSIEQATAKVDFPHSVSPLTVSNESGNFSDFSHTTSTMSSENGINTVSLTPKEGINVCISSPLGLDAVPIPDAEAAPAHENQFVEDPPPIIRMRKKSRPSTEWRKQEARAQRFSLPSADLFDRLQKLESLEYAAGLRNESYQHSRPRSEVLRYKRSVGSSESKIASQLRNLNLSNSGGNRVGVAEDDRHNDYSPNYCNSGTTMDEGYMPQYPRQSTPLPYAVPYPPSLIGISEQEETSRAEEFQGIPNIGNNDVAHKASQTPPRHRPFTTNFDSPGNYLIIENGMIRIRRDSTDTPPYGTGTFGIRTCDTSASTTERATLRDRSKIRMGVASKQRPVSMIAASNSVAGHLYRTGQSSTHDLLTPPQPPLFHQSTSCVQLNRNYSGHIANGHGNAGNVNGVANQYANCGSIHGTPSALANWNSQPATPSGPKFLYRGRKSMEQQDPYWKNGFSSSNTPARTASTLKHSQSLRSQSDSPSKRRSWGSSLFQRIFRSPSRQQPSVSPKVQRQDSRSNFFPALAPPGAVSSVNGSFVSESRSQGVEAVNGANVKLRQKRNKKMRRPMSEQIGGCGSSAGSRSSWGFWNAKDQNNAENNIPRRPIAPDSMANMHKTSLLQCSDYEAHPIPPNEVLLPIPEAEDKFLAEAPWFCAHVPRNEVSSVLCNETLGSFLVRRSTTQPGCYALSVRVSLAHSATGISQYLIYRTYRGYKIKGFAKEFPSVHSLVTHHTILSEELPCRLTFSRSVAEWCIKWRMAYNPDSSFQRSIARGYSFGSEGFNHRGSAGEDGDPVPGGLVLSVGNTDT